MVGEVDELEEEVGWSSSCLESVMDVEEGKLEEELVDKPRTIKATCFTCNRRRKSACWRSSWQVSQNIFQSNFGEDMTDLCIDCVDVQWLLALVVGGTSPSRSSWTSPRSGYAGPYRGGCSHLISSKKFQLSICGFWNCYQTGWDCLLRVEFYIVKFWRVYFVHLLKVCYHWEFLSKLLPPRTRRIRRVFRVMLCSRNGGISTGQKQKWSDILSNEPNKILWLNWFVEALFHRYFFADSCNSSGNPSTVEWSIASVTQRFLPLFSAPLFSNPIKFWTVGFRRFQQIFDRWLVDCNSNAKDFTSIQHTAIQQSQIFLNGKVSTYTFE